MVPTCAETSLKRILVCGSCATYIAYLFALFCVELFLLQRGAVVVPFAPVFSGQRVLQTRLDPAASALSVVAAANFVDVSWSAAAAGEAQ